MFTPVRNGKPQSTIHIPRWASDPERFAAVELSRCFEKTTDAKLPIEVGLKRLTAGAIIIADLSPPPPRRCCRKGSARASSLTGTVSATSRADCTSSRTNWAAWFSGCMSTYGASAAARSWMWGRAVKPFRIERFRVQRVRDLVDAYVAIGDDIFRGNFAAAFSRRFIGEVGGV